MKAPSNLDDSDVPKPRLSWLRRLAPVGILFFLAPLFGEYLLGNLKLSEFAYLPYLALLYGTGALLVREVSRRAGHGYATMLGLGIAYALIEEGLVDQLIFNPDYFAGQGELMNTVIPVFGLDAWLAVILLAMHAIWSICIPIILVEAIFAGRGQGPWLGKTGLGVVIAVFVLGSAWLTREAYLDSGFWASSSQLSWTTIVVIAIMAASLMSTSGFSGHQFSFIRALLEPGGVSRWSHA